MSLIFPVATMLVMIGGVSTEPPTVPTSSAVCEYSVSSTVGSAIVSSSSRHTHLYPIRLAR